MLKIIKASLAILLLTLCFITLKHRFSDFIYIDESPLLDAQEMYDNKNYTESMMLTSWIIEQRPDLDDDKAEELFNSSQNKIIKSRPMRFLEGMVTGEAEDMAGLLGSGTLDLFVIGDIRDVVVQGYKEIVNDDGDYIILALSAMGIATTYTPMIDWAPSLMKSFKRGKVFSKNMGKSLLKISRQAMKTGDYKTLAKVSSETASVVAKMGTKSSKTVLKNIDDTAALAKLSKATKVSAPSTYAVYAKGGSKAVKQVNNNGSNIVKISKKIKVMSRGGKMLTKTIGILPTWIILAIMALIIVLLIKPLISLLPKKLFSKLKAT